MKRVSPVRCSEHVKLTTMTAIPVAQVTVVTPVDKNRGLSVVLSEATTRALSGGLLGAAAMTVQVASLMWVSQLTTNPWKLSYFATIPASYAILYLQ